MATKKTVYEAPAPASDKKKALQTALAQIDKNFGKGTVMRLGDRPEMNVEAIPTGSLALDAALGIGGVPKGRIIEIYGPESSGKTTLALHILAEARSGAAKWPSWTRNTPLTPCMPPRWAWIRTICWCPSPIPANRRWRLPTRWFAPAPLTRWLWTPWPRWFPSRKSRAKWAIPLSAWQARLMSQALRKLAGTIAKTNCVVIFINQLRMKIGVMYGNPETTTGGNALKFYSSVRLDVRRIESIKEGNNVIGNKTRVKVVKNKVAPPFREAVFEILYGKGISKWGELVDLAVQLDIIQKSGSWFSMGDERIGQGANSVKDYLIANPDIAEKVEAEVRENLWKLNNGAPKAPAKAADKAVAVSADDFDDEG